MLLQKGMEHTCHYEAKLDRTFLVTPKDLKESECEKCSIDEQDMQIPGSQAPAVWFLIDR